MLEPQSAIWKSNEYSVTEESGPVVLLVGDGSQRHLTVLAKSLHIHINSQTET